MQIGCLILINAQSPLSVNLKELGKGAKNPLNRSWLHCQIAWRNALINKDKSDYYGKLILDNSHDFENYGMHCTKP